MRMYRNESESCIVEYTNMFKRGVLSRHGLLGITVIETLIVVTILAALAIAVITNVLISMPKARDAERKADLKEIAGALEQYYNDHGGYPLQLSASGVAVSACGTATALVPYLKDVPCDSGTQPYVYDPATTTIVGSRGEDVVRSYRLLTKLEVSSDPIISDTCPQNSGTHHCGGSYKVNTSDPTGVAIGPSNILNYGVASGTTVLE